MELIPRSASPQELPGVIDFLTQHLRAGQNWSIANEYPMVFQETNCQNIKAIFDGDKVIAHAAIKYHIIKNPVGLFKVAAIGSVVTAPEYRNMGHSQKLLEHCVQSATEDGADIAILWTDLYDFYRKLDFELAGFETSITIDKPISVPSLGLKFVDSTKIDPSAILQLYAQHTVGSIRTAEELRRYLVIPNTRVFTAWDAQNRLKAYAVEGKGADLKGYIHEWGGGVSELLALFSHARQVLNAPTTVILPRSAQNMRTRLLELAPHVNYGYLGMIRPLHTEGLILKAKRYALSLGVKDFVLEKRDDGTFVFGRGVDLFETKDLKV
ncbi:MAG: GNAT family N-acetyltransferase, partial [Bdellovibrionota bacterium]